MERAELKRLALSVPGAQERGEFVFLCDPHWGEGERAALQPLLDKTAGLDASVGWLCIPTGGTGGRLRFARHDEQTLGAAVSGFVRHFNAPVVNTVGVLPLHHVSGFMACIRCAATGGRYVAQDWKAAEAGKWPELRDEEAWFLSLVPTQLQRVLQRPESVAHLRRFRAVFVGGGPTWPELEEDAARAGLPLSLSYGMTETAAMVSAQRPEDFQAGRRDAGRVLPHAQVESVATKDVEGAEPGAGLLRIVSPSLFRGYFPDGGREGAWLTQDIGFIDAGGAVHVFGRRDAVIITGGEKVWPSEVEAVLQGSGAFADVAVIGVPDPRWGESVVACVAGSVNAEAVQRARAALERVLVPYKHPKHYVPVDAWPRNAQGKLNRAELREVARRKLSAL